MPSQMTSSGCGCGCGGSGASSCGCGCGSACAPLTGFERPRFFDGQLLTRAELGGEQSYVIDKNKLHNRYLHGWGVVCGLRVSCCDATHVTVEPGYALDPCGNDIVLGQPQTVDLLALINACRSQTRPSAECNPFLSSPPMDCTGVDQTWCLTISYAEQDARPVAALRGFSPQWAATTAGCGCGCECNGSGSAAGSTTDTVGRTATACEPTRTAETVRFGVACQPAEQAMSLLTERAQEILSVQQALTERLPAGTMVGNMLRCQAGLVLLGEEAPDPGKLDGAQAGYTAVCRWLKSIQAALASQPLNACLTADAFAAITVRPPNAQDASDEYINAVLTPAVDEGKLLLAAAVRQCLCWNLIPGCQEPPCDAAVMLACVTLRNDTIVEICMGWPRRQVVTFPALEYWMTGLGTDFVQQLPTFLSPMAFGTTVSELCCATDKREQVVPSQPAATRFYALADLSTGAPPKEAVSGVGPTEFQRIRTGAVRLRTLAVNALKQLR